MRRFLLSFAVLFTTLTFFVTPAFADEEPLRLAFVNASAKGGGSAYKTLEGFLESSKDIQLRNSDKVWGEADEVGVSKKDFRSSRRRAESAKEFRQVMKNLDIEAILIQDVFSRGRKFQLVVIGPSGEQVADIRKSVRRGRLKKSQAKEVLKEAFGELVPKVREFRENGSWAAYEEPEPEPEPEEEEEEAVDPFAEAEGEEEESIKDKVIADKKGSGAFVEGLTFNFGALVGSRDFTMVGGEDERYDLSHKSPWVGVAGRVDWIATTFGGDSAFAISVFGAYAPFTTIFEGNQEFASDYGRIGGELVYIKGFTPNVSLDVFGGAEARSVTIDRNEHYTGNRYLAARVGAFLRYSAGALSVGAGGGVLPTFGDNNSNGAFGDPESMAIGFEANAGLGFKVSDEIQANIGYTFQSVGNTFPDPQREVIVEGNPSPIETFTTDDKIHSGMVTIGYRVF